ncbi:MAG: aminodeoxychorismate/anthranilate synthase component II [Saprospiraceae bacterium]|nr:aminodeoxychorismate/anthranilate synthase component II [Candidatus Opimibacter iunctus]
MNIVLIDNYDSFTHNLAQYLMEQDRVKLTIVENDLFQLADLQGFDKIVISPGPGVPSTAGLIIETIRYFSGNKPILGICLGLQAIYEAFGGRLLNLPLVQHGVTSSITVLDAADPLFYGIHSPFKAGRYHSWVCAPEYLPDPLMITATDQEGTIMACRHTAHPTYGVQFHPESILTPEGKRMIKNFTEI